MSEKEKIFGAFILMAIYVMAVCFLFNKQITPANNDFQNTSSDFYFSSASGNLFSHTAQSEISFNNTDFPLILNLKIPFFEAGLTTFIPEKFWVSSYLQYNDFVNNLCVNRRKSDRLYPFHYFW